MCVCVCVCAGWLCASLDKLKSRLRGRANCSRGRLQFGGHAGWGCHGGEGLDSQGQGGRNREVVTATEGGARPRARAWTQKALMLLRPWECAWRQQVTAALASSLFPAAQVAASEDPPPGPGARVPQAWNSLPTWPLSRGLPRWLACGSAPGPLSPHSLSSSHMESPVNIENFPCPDSVHCQDVRRGAGTGSPAVAQPLVAAGLIIVLSRGRHRGSRAAGRLTQLERGDPEQSSSWPPRASPASAQVLEEEVWVCVGARWPTGQRGLAVIQKTHS